MSLPIFRTVAIVVGLVAAPVLHAGEGVAGPSFSDQGLNSHANDARFHAIELLYADEQRGAELFQSKSFADAYEALAEPAAQGLKRAQHLMALMYLRGEGVEQHQLKGVALLGLAAESGDRAVVREHKKAMAKLPKNVRELVNQQTDFYIARYGMDAQGVTCKTVRRPGSNLSGRDCQKSVGDHENYAWAP